MVAAAPALTSHSFIVMQLNFYAKLAFTLSVAVFLIVVSSGNVAAALHGVTSFPTLTQDADVICIGTILRPAASSQQNNRTIEGPGHAEIKVTDVLKGRVASSPLEVYIGADEYIDPGMTTALFFLNGSAHQDDWRLVPDFPQPILTVSGSSKVTALSNNPFFTVVSVLCEALPSLSKEDRLAIKHRLSDIGPLLNANNKNPDVARERAALGGLSKLEAFVKTTLFPAIEKYYSDPNTDTRDGFLDLGRQLGDVKANSKSLDPAKSVNAVFVADPKLRRTPTCVPLTLKIYNNSSKSIRLLNLFTPDLLPAAVYFDLEGGNGNGLGVSLFYGLKVSLYSWQYVYITVKPHHVFQTGFDLAQMTWNKQPIPPGRYKLSGFYGANMGYPSGMGSDADVFNGLADIPPIDLFIDKPSAIPARSSRLSN